MGGVRLSGKEDKKELHKSEGNRNRCKENKELKKGSPRILENKAMEIGLRVERMESIKEL
jgi:hypothetical protein